MDLENASASSIEDAKSPSIAIEIESDSTLGYASIQNSEPDLLLLQGLIFWVRVIRDKCFAASDSSGVGR